MRKTYRQAKVLLFSHICKKNRHEWRFLLCLDMPNGYQRVIASATTYGREAWISALLLAICITNLPGSTTHLCASYSTSHMLDGVLLRASRIPSSTTHPLEGEVGRVKKIAPKYDFSCIFQKKVVPLRTNWKTYAIHRIFFKKTHHTYTNIYTHIPWHRTTIA